MHVVHVYSVYKYSALTEEEIVTAVSELGEEHEVEDVELITDELDVPSHSEAYACLSTCIRWLQAQTDSELVAAHATFPSSSYNTTRRATKLT